MISFRRQNTPFLTIFFAENLFVSLQFGATNHVFWQCLTTIKIVGKCSSFRYEVEKVWKITFPTWNSLRFVLRFFFVASTISLQKMHICLRFSCVENMQISCSVCVQKCSKVFIGIHMPPFSVDHPLCECLFQQ